VFAEWTRGRLAPGYKAGLVLLDQDLTRIAPEAIERVAVRATVVGGRVVDRVEIARGATRCSAPVRSGVARSNTPLNFRSLPDQLPDAVAFW
jgi:adenine deaminase